jgi:hypothetical protein
MGSARIVRHRPQPKDPTMSIAFLSAVQPSLAAQDADLGAVLAALSSLSDADHAALPDVWRDLSASLVSMIGDQDMDAQDVADAVALPVEAVRAIALDLV